MNENDMRRNPFDHDPFAQKKSNCRCCHGTGVQLNKITGLVQHCPCCHGTGKEKEKLSHGIYS